MQCVAVCSSVLQCAAVCCSMLQCVAVCCSVLQCVAMCCRVLPCVAVCCSALQCVALCGSVSWYIYIYEWCAFGCLILHYIYTHTHIHIYIYRVSIHTCMNGAHGHACLCISGDLPNIVSFIGLFCKRDL